eukprot:Awhi_evm1s2945
MYFTQVINAFAILSSSCLLWTSANANSDVKHLPKYKKLVQLKHKASFEDYDTAVYTMSNQIENELVVYSDNGRGQLKKISSHLTGGKGYPFKIDDLTADVNALFSQDSVIVYKNYVYNVNTGSNSITKFMIKDADLTLEEPTVLDMPVYLNSSSPCSLVASEKLNVVCALTCVGVGSVVCFDADTNKVNENLIITDLGINDEFNSLDVFENFHGINEMVSVHDGSFTPDSEALMLTSFQGIFLYTIGVDEKNNTFKFNSKTTPTEFYPV